MDDIGRVETASGAAAEHAPEVRERPPETIPSSARTDASPVAPAAAPIIPDRPRTVVVQKTPLREDIEEALSDGLADAYAALTPTDQAKFRQVGEALANMLEPMIMQGAIDIQRAHHGIIAWLKLLPSKGRFFVYYLIQEAKVKTDAVLALARRAHGA